MWGKLLAATAKARRENLGPRSQRRVREILDTARTAFSERGYEGVTTLDIAQTMGVSEATVFTYFDSKRDLCIEVIRAWYRQITSEIEQELPLVNGTRERLHFAVEKHLGNLLHETRGLCALILIEGRGFDRDFSDIITELKRRYIGPLLDVLVDGRMRGELRSDLPIKLMRDMIYGSMEHVLWDRIASGKAPDLHQTSAHLTDMLWNAFAAPNAKPLAAPAAPTPRAASA